MPVERFLKRTAIDVPAEFAFAWHERPGAFFRLAPPWERIELIRQTGTIHDGDELEFALCLGPFRRRWLARHENFIPGVQFQDVQVAGPFRSWRHTHRIIPDGSTRCILEDDIEYELPGGWIGRWLGSRSIRDTVSRMFDVRHDVTRFDLELHWSHRAGEYTSRETSNDDARQAISSKADHPMRILLSGANGLVGTALRAMLTTAGDAVVPLTRSRNASTDAVVWDPAKPSIDRGELNDFDAVVHLAGENIATRRWSAAQKERIRDSRVAGTRFLCEQLAQLEQPPSTLICASAIGYYGDRGDEELDEEKPPADDFLANVCKEWEAATEPARQKNIRVVNLRIGVVLSAQGGALHKMLTPFKLGLGGRVGNGRQYMSWIDIDDLAGVIVHCLRQSDLSGPLNAVAPDAVTNAAFTKTLGNVLKRPTIFPLPAFMVKLLLGEMGEALLLSSTRVKSTRLEQSGYQFRYPRLESSLRHLLGR